MNLRFLNKREIRKLKLDEGFCYLKDEQSNLFKVSRDVEKIDFSQLNNIKTVGLFIGKVTELN